MKNNSYLRPICHVLLSFTAFLLICRGAAWLLVRTGWPLADWLGELAAFLIGAFAAMFLFRLLDPAVLPDSMAVRYTCSLPMSFVHVGYGLFWLVLTMYMVLLVFPITGNSVMDQVGVSLLTAVAVHPVVEEFLFRRLFLYRLLSLAVPEQTEIVPETEESSAAEKNDMSAMPAAPTGQVYTRAGTLFAVLLQAVMFGLVHASGGTSSGSGGMLYGFAGGTVLGMLMVRTGRLWVCTAAHMLLNLRSVVYPLLSDQLRLAADIALLVLGMACGMVFWAFRWKTRLRNPPAPEDTK